MNNWQAVEKRQSDLWLKGEGLLPPQPFI